MEPIVLELAAFSRCIHPQDPMPGLFHPGGGDLVLTEGGLVVTRKLHALAMQAIKGPAGMGPYRSLLFVARQAFSSGNGEACAAAAVLLGDVAEVMLLPDSYEPEGEDLEEVA